MDKITPTSLRLVLPLLFLYLLITLLALSHHELALEEAQFFLFGRDSDSLSSLYHNMQYEGHPRLWCSLLFLIYHHITTAIAGMQALHLLVTTATVFLFLRYAPFSVLHKVLVIGGYYFLFEYDILSRNYALGILFLFICCMLLRDPRKNLFWIGGMLVLLCNTHLFFSFGAIGIFVYLLFEYGRAGKILSPSFLGFTILAAAGVLSALVQARISAPDYILPARPEEWLSAKNRSAAYYALIRGWLPIPKVEGGNFWNSFWLDDHNIGWVLRDGLFVFFLVLPVLILKKYEPALLFYGVSLAVLLTFFIVHPISAARYFGIGFVFFLAACWIADPGSGDFLSLKHLADMPVVRRGLRGAIYALLVLQVLVGVYALQQDFSRPFSQAKNAVSYIRAQGLDRQEIVVDGYIAGPALSVYLGKKIFYLDIGQKGSYCIWIRSNFPHPALTLEQEMMRTDLLRGMDRFILVSNRRVDTTGSYEGGTATTGVDTTGSRMGDFRFVPLGDFPNSITSMENSYLYQVTRKTGGHPLARILRL
ncbi:MAG TPA: hypothetical protein VGM30_23285 [Puia sp.]